MSTKINQLKFNTESLLNNVNKVIQNGINDMLNNYIDNYKLYEETHNYIMNLPCIKRENSRIGLNNNVVCNKTDFSGEEPNIDIVLLDKYLSDKDEETESISTEDSQEEEYDDALLYMSNALLKETEKKYKTIVETRDKEIEDLKKRLQITQEQNDKRYDMFYQEKDLYEELIKKYVREIEDLKNQLKDCIKKPVICDLTADESEKEFVEIKQEKVEEKENITLHIEEESEVEETDEESDEDDINPHMITCSSITIQKEENILSNSESENEKVVDEDEELVNDVEEEDEELVNDVEEEDEEVEEDEELIDEVVEEVVEEDEEVVDEEDDAIETEKSSSDKESQKEDDEKDEDEEQELIEIEIDDVLYCTENEENGFIYEIDEEGNVGEPVGYFKNGEPFFN